MTDTLTSDNLTEFRSGGCTIVRGLFTRTEIERYIEHYEALWQQTEEGKDSSGYPRLLQPHRWDDISRDFLLDARIGNCLTALLGDEPYGVQTMVYFKPPGAKGQALHQDQYFLRAQPGTCVAAWMALDDCNEENGCLQYVPGTHELPLLCLTESNGEESFTDITVPIPDGMSARPALMQAGDVFFFNGQLVHGSYPNRTTDRSRKSLIGHYILGEANQVAEFYHPALRFDGSTVELGVSEQGGECGTWVEREGEMAVALQPV